MDEEINGEYEFSVEVEINNENNILALFKYYVRAESFYNEKINYYYNLNIPVDLRLIKLEDCSIIKQFRTQYDC